MRRIALALTTASIIGGIAAPSQATTVLTTVFEDRSTTTIGHFTVQNSDFYEITIAGASGGGVSGGSPIGVGAVLVGSYYLAAGTSYNVLVGTEGMTTGDAGSGGGGSFLVAVDGTPLLVAGGGGGAGSAKGLYNSSYAGKNASFDPGGNIGGSPKGTASGGAGGVNGNGGMQAAGTGGGFGGGGFSGPATLAPIPPGPPLNTSGGSTVAYLAGFAPAAYGASYAQVIASVAANGAVTETTGGFGVEGGGGGGGYSGGGGGAADIASIDSGLANGGGGGGSFASSSALGHLVSENVNFGDGYVLIQHFVDMTTSTDAAPEPSTWTTTILGFGAVAGAARRRRSFGEGALVNR